MSIPGAANPLLLRTAAAGGYTISRSLRFNSSDSAYLSRSYSSSPTDRTKQTISFWAKFSNLTSTQRLFWGYDGSSNEAGSVSFSGSQIYFSFGGASTRAVFTTPAVFRDPSAWYHILIKVDSTTTDPVTGHRVAIFVNGVQQTTGSDVISVNALSQFGLANSNNRIGCSNGQTDFISAYLADVFYIDGQALTPSSFGQFDTNNVWQPKAYTGSYSGNSFHLDFADNSAATATALGKDTSGNGNNWTPNNLSVSTSFFSASPVPSYPQDAFNGITGDYAYGGSTTVFTLNPSAAVVGGRIDMIGRISSNYTYKAITNAGTFTLSEIGDWPGVGGTYGRQYSVTNGSITTLLGVQVETAAGNWTLAGVQVAGNPATVGTQLLIYAYGVPPTDSLVDSPVSSPGQTDSGAGGTVVGNYCTWNPLVYSSGLSNGNLDVAANQARGTQNVFDYQCYWEITSMGGTRDAGVQKADGTSNAITIASGKTYGFRTGSRSVQYINITDSGSWTTWLTSANVGSTEPYFPYVTGGGATSILNAGQRAFAATAPSGYKALCTANLPTPTIANGATAMDVKLYTGNGSTQTISGLGFSPDLVWIKGRSGATDHALYDAVRGVQKDLVSNSTAAETTQTTGLTAFNSGGFDLGSLAKLNTSSATYAAWCWDAGSSTVTNTQGSITSQVRANASAGFSIVTYTGNNTSGATVGHGLGVAPGFVIIKSRSGSTNWIVGHSAAGWLSAFEGLNTTDGFRANDAKYWNNTAPTSTVITFGNEGNLNGSGANFVAYCFAPVAGYSSFGSYTGNGSADGPFVYTGFRPRWIILKNASAVWNWQLRDTARDTYNPAQSRLFPNTSDAQSTNDPVDILSNGFKIRVTGGDYNGNGNTFVWAAFAESPFAYARAR